MTWILDPAITYLNHGSFGACPAEVLAAQTALRERLERQPVEFLARDLEPLLDEARAALAAFLGADAEDLAFVPNATTGVNAILRSLDLRAGDELLVTDHAYNACRNALDHTAARAGARVVVAPLPFPVAGEDELVAPLLERITPRTRLALVDHVTSQTALVLPIARIVAELQARGIDVLVDGAHAPGMVPLDLTALGAAYYVGNCHKWLCAPKGAGFLVARADRKGALAPVSISHGWNQPERRPRFRLLFDWTGTDDPTPYLCVPPAIAWLGARLPGGWDELRARNHALAVAARALLCDALEVPAPCPESLLGSMASVPISDGDADALNLSLVREHGIEVPVFPWPAPPRRLVRLSAQLYNELAQYQRLAPLLSASSPPRSTPRPPPARSP